MLLMSIWRWAQVKQAKIDEKQREIFESYGENVIALIVAGGFNPVVGDLYPLYSNAQIKQDARNWLAEQGAKRERREDRLETLETAILLLVAAELVINIASAFHWIR
jgi:hypothetical protein